jgi:hypothetical protein
LGHRTPLVGGSLSQRPAGAIGSVLEKLSQDLRPGLFFCRPFGAGSEFHSQPTARAVGCALSPLRGGGSSAFVVPALAKRGLGCGTRTRKDRKVPPLRNPFAKRTGCSGRDDRVTQDLRPGLMSVAPPGLVRIFVRSPRLAPWAVFFRRCAAGDHRRSWFPP